MRGLRVFTMCGVGVLGLLGCGTEGGGFGGTGGSDPTTKSVTTGNATTGSPTQATTTASSTAAVTVSSSTGAVCDGLTDPGHCGATGDCQGVNAGVVCASGMCESGLCACTGLGEINCGPGCIGPATDHDHCGATGSCTGSEAGNACSASEVCCHGTCANTCTGVLAPANLDPLTCEYPASSDLVVAAGDTLTLSTSTDTGCSEVRVQANAPEICVVRYANIQIQGAVRVVGHRALALVATGDFTVEGSIDASAILPMFKTSALINGPGASSVIGGGYGTPGGGGSPAYGNDELVPLIGGSKGGSYLSIGCGEAGGGGGALELVACGAVTISGVVNAGGGAAEGGCETPGPNGGSGGGILVEGSSVTITGGVFANGGGGGGGGFTAQTELMWYPGEPGANASASTSPAAGGIGTYGDCYPFGYTGSGGAGGTITSAAQPGGLPVPTCGNNGMCGLCYHGGPGGAVGRVRVNALAGAADVDVATISPAPTMGVSALDLP